MTPTSTGRPDDPRVAAVAAAEESLLSPRTRADRRALEALLADDFSEFGVSGHAWERDEIIDALLADPDTDDIRMTDVDGREVAPGLVLLTYTTSDLDGPRARRTSLWRLEGERWRMVHHQGSPHA